MRRAKAKAAAPDAGVDVTAQFAVAPISVSALVGRIKEAMLDAFPGRLAVVGEISNFKHHSSGHLYFCLKDATSAIDAVMFRVDASSVRFDLADGLEVVAEGRVDVFDRNGRLQFYVSRLSPRGAGALELAYRQLKDRLAKEGLFDPAHKVAIPRFPRAIGVVTSPTGAAVRDIYRALTRRWPAATVYLLPVRVQGEAAGAEIAGAIATLDQHAAALGIDTIITGRGGGSMEDLWAFNEEVVARAIFACKTPIICGVGHEEDFTIADFVADLRAATPTAAAELAVPDQAELRRHVGLLGQRLHRRVAERLQGCRAELASVQRSAVFRDPSGPLRSAQQRLDELTTRLVHRLQGRLRQDEGRLHELRRRLAGLHPRHLAQRAYGRLESLRRDLAWALGHRAKQAGDHLREVEAALAAVHPRNRLKLGQLRLEALGRQLEAMSYRSVLRRGYSVTRISGGGLVQSSHSVRAGDVLETEWADGKVESVVVGDDGSIPLPPTPPKAQRPVRRGNKKDQPGPGLFGPTDG